MVAYLERRHKLTPVTPSLGRLTSSALLYCPDEPTLPPGTATVTDTATVTATVTFTKTWEYAAWAACPTAEWPALYTIVEVCTGDPDVWTQPAIPPNFIKTVVTCGVCEQQTQTITCPVEEAAQTGDVTIYGNGVTATPAWAPAQATDAPGSGMGPGPGSGSGPGSMPGSMPGMDSGPGAGSGPGANGAGSGPGSGSPAPGAGSGSSPNMDMGAGGNSPAGAPMPAPNNNNGGAAPGSSPGSGSGSSPAPGSGSGSEPGAAPAPGGGEAGGSSPTMVEPQSHAGTDGASSPYATAAAPTLKSTLLLVSGMFALVSGSIVCY